MGGISPKRFQVPDLSPGSEVPIFATSTAFATKMLWVGFDVLWHRVGCRIESGQCLRNISWGPTTVATGVGRKDDIGEDLVFEEEDEKVPQAKSRSQAFVS